MERKKISSLGEALERYLADSPIADGLRYSRVCRAWDEAVGGAVASYTLSKKFENGVFTARLNSSVLRMQLEMIKDDIRRRMNESLGGDMVVTLNLR